MSTSHPVDLLSATYPSLGHVPRALGTEMVRSSRAFSGRPRDILFEAGAPCPGFPLVLRGGIRMSRPLASGQEVMLYRLGPGDVCALSVQALLSDTPLAARAQVLEEVAGVVLPPALFDELLDQHPPFRRFVLSESAARTVRLVTLLEQVAAGRLDDRLARLLLERGPVLSMTHQALADELGTAREVVSRILEGFETRGAVRLRRGRVEVLDGSRFTRPARVPAPLHDGTRLAG